MILLPQEPTYDEVASALSLYLALSPSQQVSVACPTPMRVEFNRLVGVDKVVAEPGNKNMVIKLMDYDAQSIDKISYDINPDGHMELTITPKAELEAPQKDQVIVAYRGVSSDMVVLVGGEQLQDFPDMANTDLAAAQVVHVGIHEVTGIKNVVSFAQAGTAVSEVVALLLSEEENLIDADIATNLLSGMNASESFANQAVRAETFTIAATLMKKGGKYLPQDKITRERFPMGSIPGEAPQFQGNFPKPNPFKAPKAWMENPKILKGTSV